MELRQNTRYVVNRPMAWVVVILTALMLGLMAWFTHPTTALTHSTIATPIATAVESPRSGGPGGQIGDAPQQNQPPRVGGPGGQLGDVP